MRTEARKTDRRRRLLAAASGLLFCASCVVSPVVRFDDTPEGWQVLTPALLSDGTGADLGGFGFAYLLTGWMGLIYGASCLGNLAWLANAGYFAAIVLFLRDKRREARTAAAATLLLGSMFLRRTDSQRKRNRTSDSRPRPGLRSVARRVRCPGRRHGDRRPALPKTRMKPTYR